jgi:hypothetical protein
VWFRIPLAALLLCPLLAAETTVVRHRDGSFQVEGWNPGAAEPDGGWQAVLSVYAGEGDLPPMLGAYSVESGRLTFRPKYPVGPGVAVRAVFRPAAGGAIEVRFDAAAGLPAPTTRVSNIYPTVNALPENQLKFYVVFTAPMQRGEAWQRISLADENGKKVDLPFLEIDQELWDRDFTRLTILFDPGRIKRGVQPLEEVGPAIAAGHSYTLSISREWRDSRGVPLKEGFEKRFRVVEADREPIDPRKWTITPPRVSTRLPLIVDFGEPLDYALAQRMIDVEGMRGHAALERDQTRWTFVPDRAWPAGEFRLKVDAALEDLAGNRVGRPFDVDVFEKVTRQPAKQTVLVPFTVRGD